MRSEDLRIYLESLQQISSPHLLWTLPYAKFQPDQAAQIEASIVPHTTENEVAKRAVKAQQSQDGVVDNSDEFHSDVARLLAASTQVAPLQEQSWSELHSDFQLRSYRFPSSSVELFSHFFVCSSMGDTFARSIQRVAHGS